MGEVSRSEAPRIVVARHGETQWSRNGRHTGASEVPLTNAGEAQALRLGAVLEGRAFGLVLASPRERARRTAELAGRPDYEIDPALAEWDYGPYEGRSTPEIRREYPGWSIWEAGRDGSPRPGETLADVGARADAVLERLRPVLDGGDDVLLFAHSHLLRILAARWLGLAAAAGAHFVIDAAARGELGREHSAPVLCAWNLPS